MFKLLKEYIQTYQSLKLSNAIYYYIIILYGSFKKISRLNQPSLAADMAPLLKSKESNKANDLKSLKTDLLERLKIVNIKYHIEDSYQ